MTSTDVSDKFDDDDKFDDIPAYRTERVKIGKTSIFIGRQGSEVLKKFPGDSKSATFECLGDIDDLRVTSSIGKPLEYSVDELKSSLHTKFGVFKGRVLDDGHFLTDNYERIKINTSNLVVSEDIRLRQIRFESFCGEGCAECSEPEIYVSYRTPLIKSLVLNTFTFHNPGGFLSSQLKIEATNYLDDIDEVYLITESGLLECKSPKSVKTGYKILHAGEHDPDAMEVDYMNSETGDIYSGFLTKTGFSQNVQEETKLLILPISVPGVIHGKFKQGEYVFIRVSDRKDRYISEITYGPGRVNYQVRSREDRPWKLLLRIPAIEGVKIVGNTHKCFVQRGDMFVLVESSGICPVSGCVNFIHCPVPDPCQPKCERICS